MHHLKDTSRQLVVFDRIQHLILGLISVIPLFTSKKLVEKRYIENR